MQSQIKTLRNKKALNLFSTKDKLFIHLQINTKENFICWQRFVSKDRRNWVEWNNCLSLKDCWKIIKSLHKKII